MARRRRRQARAREAVATARDPNEQLRSRARRLARDGKYRKAALALRRVAAMTGEPAAWVALGNMLARARRGAEAIDALRQGLWLHRRRGALARARTVARMIVAIDPYDAQALRLAEAV